MCLALLRLYRIVLIGLELVNSAPALQAERNPQFRGKRTLFYIIRRAIYP